MKFKSLLLGSAAALALSSAALAADANPVVSVVSLDACDAFGITGLTISTNDTCLLISGEVQYDFKWGDYAADVPNSPLVVTSTGNFDAEDDDGNNDWDSRTRWELTFEATSETDMGMATAVLTLEGDDRYRAEEGVYLPANGDLVTEFSEAYVSVGDTTVLTAGLVDGGLANVGDDESFTTLETFLSEGDLEWTNGINDDGGHVIQLVTELGDGISAGIGLERLNADVGDSDQIRPGTLVGVVEADQAWGSAHFTVLVNDVLNGFIDPEWAIHTGATVDFDPVRVRAAIVADDNDYIAGLLTAEASFDMFTIAGTVEATSEDELGFGASVSADVTETIEVNLGFRYFNEGNVPLAINGLESWQVEGEVVAGVAENLEATVALGMFTGGSLAAGLDPLIYGSVGLEYTPSDSVTIEGGAEVNSAGGYNLTFGASKSF